VRAGSASAVAAAVAAASALAAGAAGAHPDPLTSGHAVIAHVVAPVAARSSPALGRVVTRIGALARWNGGPVGLLVLAERTGPDGRLWLRVRLPQRPNGAECPDPCRQDARRRHRLADRRLGRQAHRRARARRQGRARVSGGRGRPRHAHPHRPLRSQRTDQAARPPRLLRPVGAPAHRVLEHPPPLRRRPRADQHPGRDGTSLHDPLGSARSHGCIRIDDAGIELLARVAVEGTPVIIGA
jgi:hypothetical protein